jgi:hypothetical protein
MEVMSKPEPSNAPTYCAMYPDLAKIARQCGYALAVHGSVARDFDLVCIPWVECPSEPYKVVSEIRKAFALVLIGEPETKEHGRVVWTLSIGFGDCFLDLSFMPLYV